MFHPPAIRPHDIPTHTKRPQSLSSTVTIYHCNTSTLCHLFIVTSRPKVDGQFVHLKKWMVCHSVTLCPAVFCPIKASMSSYMRHTLALYLKVDVLSHVRGPLLVVFWFVWQGVDEMSLSEYQIFFQLYIIHGKSSQYGQNDRKAPAVSTYNKK
jgi:hypothetical protein